MKHFLSTSPSPTLPILDSYFLSFLVSLCKEKQFSTTPDPDQYTKILQLFFFHRCIVFHCVLVMVSVALPVDGGLLSIIRKFQILPRASWAVAQDKPDVDGECWVKRSDLFSRGSKLNVREMLSACH